MTATQTALSPPKRRRACAQVCVSPRLTSSSIGERVQQLQLKPREQAGKTPEKSSPLSASRLHILFHRDSQIQSARYLGERRLRTTPLQHNPNLRNMIQIENQITSGLPIATVNKRASSHRQKQLCCGVNIIKGQDLEVLIVTVPHIVVFQKNASKHYLFPSYPHFSHISKILLKSRIFSTIFIFKLKNNDLERLVRIKLALIVKNTLIKYCF